VRFKVPLEATIEAESQVAAEIAAEKVNKLLASPYLRITLQSSGVKLVGSPTVGKPVPVKT
jgi:hypothetical protein